MTNQKRLADIEARHQPSAAYTRHCFGCGERWPCESQWLLEQLKAARAERDDMLAQREHGREYVESLEAELAVLRAGAAPEPKCSSCNGRLTHASPELPHICRRCRHENALRRNLRQLKEEMEVLRPIARAVADTRDPKYAETFFEVDTDVVLQARAWRDREQDQ